MFERVMSQFSRKRVASEGISAQQLVDKTNYYSQPLTSPPKEKRMKTTQKVCLQCLAGESGHITHVLSEIPK